MALGKLAQLYVDIETRSGRVPRQLQQLHGSMVSRLTAAGWAAGRAGGSAMANATLVAFRAGIIGLGALLTAGIAAGGFAVKLASEAEEVESKFRTVFAELSDQSEAWAKRFAGDVGRSTTEVKKQLASLQDTFVPLGFARDEAAELSKQFVTLGTDLASFNNIADSDAIDSLTSALIGNHETVRKFGVIITEASLKAELLRMGIAGGTKAATEQEKVLARMNLILAGTTDAQGDAVRTAGSFANMSKALRGSLADLSVEVGQVLLPAITEVVGWLRDMTKYMQENSSAMENWGGGIADYTRNSILGLRLFFENFSLIHEMAVTKAAVFISEWTDYFAYGFKFIGELAVGTFAGLANMLDVFFERWKEIFTAMADTASRPFRVVGAGIKWLADGNDEEFERAVSAAMEARSRLEVEAGYIIDAIARGVEDNVSGFEYSGATQQLRRDLEALQNQFTDNVFDALQADTDGPRPDHDEAGRSPADYVQTEFIKFLGHLDANKIRERDRELQPARFMPLEGIQRDIQLRLRGNEELKIQHKIAALNEKVVNNTKQMINLQAAANAILDSKQDSKVAVFSI